MKLKELYEYREGLAAMKSEKQKELDAMKIKLGGMKNKAATDEELTALQESAQSLTDEIAALVGQEEEAAEQIDGEEKALNAAAAAAKNAIRGKAASGKSLDYLKTKQALTDFAETLLAAGNDRSAMRKAWAAKLAEKGITNPELLYPEPVVSAIQDAFDAAGSIFATLKKAYGFTVYSNAMNTVTNDTARAHQHKPGTTKMEQVITLEEKEISCDFIYKYLPIPKKVLRETQSTGAVIKYVLAELPQRIIWEIERAAIIGDGRATAATGKVTSFEAVTEADEDYCAEVPATGDMYVDVINAIAKVRAAGAKYLVTSTQAIADMRTAKGDDGHLVLPIGIDIAATFGVSAVFTPDWFAEATDEGDVAAVVYVGDSYTVIGDDTIENYDNFVLAKNESEYLAELYTGGALMTLNSASKIVVPEEA
jgi:hypothetical protein